MGQAVPDGLIQIDTTSQVFPVFVTKFMPKLFGGVVLGTLFITVVVGGSGLALGMASILVTDIFVRKDPPHEGVQNQPPGHPGHHYGHPGGGGDCGGAGARGHDQRFRLPLYGPAGRGGLPAYVRGLWLKGKIPGRFALASIVAGPIAVLAGSFMNLPFDSLFLGMAVCLVIMAAGLAAGKHQNETLSHIDLQ